MNQFDFLVGIYIIIFDVRTNGIGRRLYNQIIHWKSKNNWAWPEQSQTMFGQGRIHNQTIKLLTAFNVLVMR